MYFKCKYSLLNTNYSNKIFQLAHERLVSLFIKYGIYTKFWTKYEMKMSTNQLLAWVFKINFMVLSKVF